MQSVPRTPQDGERSISFYELTGLEGRKLVSIAEKKAERERGERERERAFYRINLISVFRGIRHLLAA